MRFLEKITTKAKSQSCYRFAYTYIVLKTASLFEISLRSSRICADWRWEKGLRGCGNDRWQKAEEWRHWQVEKGGRIELLKYERARRRMDLMEKEEISFRIKVMKCRGVEVTSWGI